CKAGRYDPPRGVVMVALTLQFDRETCAACGKDTTRGRSFMRVYGERGRLEFCSPTCAQDYNDDPARFGAPPRIMDAVGWFDAGNVSTNESSCPAQDFA